MNPDTTFSISPSSPWLAPLAGYSDLAFRLLCRRHGAAVCCTEMVSAKGMVYKSPGTAPLLRTTPEDAPLVVQLFGADATYIRQSMDQLLDAGFRNFDLNAGCPVPKVVKTGCGAAMMKDLDNLVKIASTMIEVAARHGRVGIKFRLGWENGADTYLELGQRLQDMGAAWVTLHPRSARQGFTGTADWPALARLKQTLDIPVIASGDLLTPADGVRCVRETGVDAVMFARGALRNPRIFDEYRHMLDADFSDNPLHGPEQLMEVIREHLDLVRHHDGTRGALLKMRTVMPRYVKDMPGAGALRKTMTSCTSYEECERLMAEHLGVDI